MNTNYLIRSICHFSNISTFGDIDDGAIGEMENFVREDLLDLLQNENATRKQVPLMNFFGLYHANTTKFRFLPGEKVMIKRIADHIKQISADNDKVNQFKAPKKYKIPRKDTCHILGMTLYSKKYNNRKESEKIDDIVLDIEQQRTEHRATESGAKLSLRSKLFSIAKEKYESKYPSLADKEYLNESMVMVTKNGSRITGSVQCIFCMAEKKAKRQITIQYDENSVGLCYWNFSNLFKHFKKHTKGDLDLNFEAIATNNPENYEMYDVLENLDENLNEDDAGDEHSSQHKSIDAEGEEIEVIVLENSELNSSGEIIAEMSSDSDNEPSTADLDINSIQFAVYGQISSQILDLTTAIYTNSEKKRSMNFTLNNKSTKLDVVKINGNGSCLFATTSHQLSLHKINSVVHKQATTTLRISVAKYIKDNMEDFVHVIAGRIQEEEESKLGYVETKSCDIDKTCCEEFVDTKLTDETFFGGIESIKAITLMYSVNMLVFNESGPAYFPMSFNPNYHKTIFMAYRLKRGSRTIRNHYDSVTEVNPKILWELVKAIIGTDPKNDNDESIMEVN